MREYVARLLQRSPQSRKLLRVTLDGDQAELVEKLSLFFSRQTNTSFTESQVIEEAVRAFVDESAQYIADEFDVNIRETTLSEMRQYQSGTTVDICVRDTVVMPMQDNQESRGLMEKGGGVRLQMDRNKLDCTKFIAFYLGTPTSAITHYARITRFETAQEGEKKLTLYFDRPEKLKHKLEWGDPVGKGLRRPRYTVLTILLDARMIEELF